MRHLGDGEVKITPTGSNGTFHTGNSEEINEERPLPCYIHIQERFTYN